MQGASCVRRMALITAAAASLAACATVDRDAGGPKVGKPYQVNGVWYVPREQPRYNAVGIASWYGDAFQMRPTASGEIFDMNAVSGAHTTLPLPSIVEVTNLDNGRRLRVRVNDRGPFVGDRIIDLSREAARELGYDRQGLARVRVRYVGPAPLLGRDAGVRIARAEPPRPPVDRVAFPAAPTPGAAPPLEVSPAMPVTRGFRIQAGAFSQEVNARRAAAQLGALAPAVVEPLSRDGVTLYRVFLSGPADELQAYGLREQVARAGFADARVVGPF